MNTIIDTITTTRKKRKTITDFYTRITFSITIEVVVSLVVIVIYYYYYYYYKSEIVDVFAQKFSIKYCVIFLCFIIDNQLKYSPIIVFPFNSTSFFPFFDLVILTYFVLYTQLLVQVRVQFFSSYYY